MPRLPLWAVALLCAVALPAFAQDHIAWGSPSTNGPPVPCSVRILRCDGPDCVARVVVHNGLLVGGGSNVVTVALDGLAVVVDYTAAASELPDTVAVLPPPGYTAIPDRLLLEEFTDGEILIVLNPLS